MFDPYFLLLPFDQAVQVHEAGHVHARDHLGAGLFMVGYSIQAHPAGDGCFLDRERTAETAAFIRPL